MLGVITLSPKTSSSMRRDVPQLGFFLIGLTRTRATTLTRRGQAMWAVADHFLFLSMKDDNVNFIAKNSDY